MSAGKTYVDSRGWRYRVQTKVGGGAFKGHYWTPERMTWCSIRLLSWRDTADEAQTDLDAYARKKQWQVDGE